MFHKDFWFLSQDTLKCNIFSKALELTEALLYYLAMVSKEISENTGFSLRHDLFACLFLVVATLAVYWQIQSYDFVNFDDDHYVYENRHVKTGLTLKSIIWAFSFAEKEKTYWHPVAWLSHMLDCQLYGLKPGKHHLTNLIFHIANSLLLFMVFKWMTGAFWRSAVIATLFAIHPINVDSVAWITERKNVLSTFFWILTMLAYVYYAKQPAFHKYLMIVLVYVLGLMTKPMLVTLPCVLLLLDYWPLGRLSYRRMSNNRNGKNNRAIISGSQGFSPFLLVLEKMPLLVLSVLSIRISSLSFQGYGKTISMSLVPLKLRIANALVSYVKYIGKMIWPQNLAVFYPYPTEVPLWQVIGALVFLGAISVFIIRSERKAPCFVIGWLWYLGTLVPVIGLVQVGLWPAMADRFAYVPLIGLFIIIAWGVPELTPQWRYRKIWFATLATVSISVLMIVAWQQIRYWKNSITLFEHNLKVATNHFIPHNNIGAALAKQGRLKDAIDHYLLALRLKPDYGHAHNNLGIALAKQGRIEEAKEHYVKALKIKPDYAEANYNLGNALEKQGRIEEAIEHYAQALKIKPDYVKAYNNLGVALDKQGRIEEAIEHYAQALKIKPDYEEAHNNMGNVLMQLDRLDEASKHYSEALRINPTYYEAHNNLGNVLSKQGRLEEAIKHYSEALQINPAYAEAQNNMGVALAETGRSTEAVDHYLEALRLNPDYVEAHMNLGAEMNKQGQIDEAVSHYKKALSLRPDLPEAIYHLAKLYIGRGEYETALSLYDKMIDILPDNPAGYYNIACIYAKQYRPKDSVAWLKKAVAKGFNDWNHIKSDKDLDNIRNSLPYKEFIKGR